MAVLRAFAPQFANSISLKFQAIFSEAAIVDLQNGFGNPPQLNKGFGCNIHKNNGTILSSISLF
jgi:hypothetical protein